MKIINDKVLKKENKYITIDVLLDIKQHVMLRLALSDSSIEPVDIDNLDINCLADLRLQRYMPSNFRPSMSNGTWSSMNLTPENIERLKKLNIKLTEYNSSDREIVAFFVIHCYIHYNEQCKELFENQSTYDELIELLTEYLANI